MLESRMSEIEAVVGRHPDGIGVKDIARELDGTVPRRTLQYRLARLVAMQRLVRSAQGRSTVYGLPETQGAGLPISPSPSPKNRNG